MEAKILSELEKILDYEVGRASVIIEAREILGKVKGLQSFYSDLVKKNERQAEENKKLEDQAASLKSIINDANADAEAIREKANANAKTVLEAVRESIKQMKEESAEAEKNHSEKINGLLDQIKELNEETAKAKAEYEKISAALDKKKAEIKSIIGD